MPHKLIVRAILVCAVLVSPLPSACATSEHAHMTFTECSRGSIVYHAWQGHRPVGGTNVDGRIDAA